MTAGTFWRHPGYSVRCANSRSNAVVRVKDRLHKRPTARSILQSVLRSMSRPRRDSSRAAWWRGQTIPRRATAGVGASVGIGEMSRPGGHERAGLTINEVRR